jgi:hypothetical protein
MANPPPAKRARKWDVTEEDILSDLPYVSSLSCVRANMVAFPHSFGQLAEDIRRGCEECDRARTATCGGESIHSALY